MERPADLIRSAVATLPRARLATLPTPLETGPELPDGTRLLVKRDDLTGLGMGGNKARKLEFICGSAATRGIDTLVTVGAAQSNHARMTAAACGRLGWEAHLVLGKGDPGAKGEQGNQLLARLFGAHMHHQSSADWDDLETAAADLAVRLTTEGRRVEVVPMGGSNPLGVAGYLLAWAEFMDQCVEAGETPRAVVVTSSTGGTHAGLLAGQAVYRAAGAPTPDLVAIGVAKRSTVLAADSERLARACLQAAGLPPSLMEGAKVEVDDSMVGEGYAIPTRAADEAMEWAGVRGGLVLDRVYTAKAFSGLLRRAVQGCFPPGSSVVFWHTGGQPAVFSPGGAPGRVER